MLIVASDFDGTLANKGWPTEENKAAVAAFRARGGHFGIVSGRHYSIARDLDVVTGGIDFLISCTGALIMDGERNILFHKTAPIDEAVRAAVLLAKKMGAVNFGIGLLDEYVHLDLSKEDPLEDCPLTEYDHNNTWFTTEEEAGAYAAYIDTHMSGEICAYQNRVSVDMPPVGCSKVSALHWYLARHPGATLYTVGDNYNDIPMLEEFPSYAVAHGVDAAKQVADHITPSVAAMLEELLPENK